MSAPTRVSQSIVQTTSTSGESFVRECYYKPFDKNRSDISLIIDDSSIVVWNGNPHQGKTDVINFLSSLPSSQHTLTSIDVQHVPGTIKGQKARNIMVCVCGKVKYEGDLLKDFTQTFLLRLKDDGKFFIASDCFRFIE